ncbi:hypothetical protein GJ496_006349 [Pomphorhynchus laevis]|nr:hypothetical protein GJ496_006349 [Pomphorhynchus laevis]
MPYNRNNPKAKDKEEAFRKKTNPKNSVNATGKCNRNFTVTDDSIMHAIRTFLSTSTSGPDGLTPQHLKDLTGPLSGITNSRL